MRLLCGVCKLVAFNSLHITSEKAVEEVLLKFGKHLQKYHTDVIQQLTLNQQRCTGLIGTIMLADQLEKDETDSDNDRFTDVIEKGVNGLLEALGIEYNDDDSKTAENEPAASLEKDKSSTVVAIDEVGSSSKGTI